MIVYIGKYPSRVVFRFHTKYMDRKYNYIWDKSSTRFERFLEKLEWHMQGVANWTVNLVLDRLKRITFVKLNPSDTWSMDSTLGHIVLPMLIQLKKTKHGYPIVDPSDTPHLPPAIKDIVNPWDDPHAEARWNFVLDEMIWAFDYIVNVEDTETDHNPVSYKRMKNGLRLFGTYYTNLWD